MCSRVWSPNTARRSDEVKPGHSGKLFIEVVPRSFAIRVRPGDSLSQIRFQTGDPRLSRADWRRCSTTKRSCSTANCTHCVRKTFRSRRAWCCRSNLPVKGDTIGYQARRNTAPIDLRGIGAAKVRHFWNSIYGDNRPVVLEPDEFYIFSSRELVRLPPMYCAEMVAFDASSGEVRTHYARLLRFRFRLRGGSRSETQRRLGRAGSAQPGCAVPDRRRSAPLPRSRPAQPPRSRICSTAREPAPTTSPSACD